MRAHLGLDPEQRAVVSGHQPIFFHCGILARFIAARRAADAMGATLVHLVIDHDMPGTGVEYPRGEGLSLSVGVAKYEGVTDSGSMRDQGRIRMEVPSEAPRGVAVMSEALEAAPGASAADQVAAATDALMAPWARVDATVCAHDLLASPLGAAMVEKMHSDGDRCRDAWNESVASVVDCGVSPLDDGELPLWHGPANDRRGDWEDLRPRAMVTTLLARIGLGDLFVHGLGGCRYDVAMESWSEKWLGVAPAPAVLATASMRLPLLPPDWRAQMRRSFSDPEGGAPGPHKQELLDVIDAAAPGSAARRGAFDALQGWLAQQGMPVGGDQLGAAWSIATRRDWSFALHDHDAIDVLSNEIC